MCVCTPPQAPEVHFFVFDSRSSQPHETLVRQATYRSHLFAAQERLSSLANKNIHCLTYIYLKEVFV